MSKQDSAMKHWEEQNHMARIEYLVTVANDPMNPVGQAQAGIQLARVEVPWLLEEITRLKGQLNGTQSVAAIPRSA